MYGKKAAERFWNKQLRTDANQRLMKLDKEISELEKELGNMQEALGK